MRTKNEDEAIELLVMKNRAHLMLAMNMQKVKMFLGDPRFGERTWEFVLNKNISQKHGLNREHWENIKLDAPFSDLWAKLIVDTTSKGMLVILGKRTV